MNERIKQLAEQAHEYSCAEYTKRLETETADQIFFNKIFNQKFALLIVRECLKFVEPDQTSGDEWCVTLDETAQSIKQHFGVEE